MAPREHAFSLLVTVADDFPWDRAEKKEQVEDNRWFVPSARAYLFMGMFIFIFMLTCVELGLVSYQIHKYGRFAENYASLQYKNSLGLLLCAVLISLLLCIGHYWIAVGFTAFVSLILAVFFGTVAGIIRTATPFRGTSCGNAVDLYPVKWQPYVGECRRIIAMEAFAWTLWALYIFLMIGCLSYIFRITVRPTPGKYYWSPTHAVPSYV
ncbi:hypothetical protein BDN70DRAFT_937487 [Pholiota conissans]|uniref:MARVEL domain-containing protein n=1 Tax=Pholiota conissans TaxID=109636 RepID=A0A9P5YRF3_9AGAR|nr:hypothetical protein BDN70DRAFT_937487 [Pholiota conissans]